MSDSYPLGVVISSEEPVDALRKVKELGLPTCQLYAPPQSWRTPGGVSKIKEALQKTCIKLTSLICAFTGEDYSSFDTSKKTAGFVNHLTWRKRPEEVISTSDFASKIGVQIVQGHIRFIPDKSTKDYEEIVSAVQRIAKYLAENSQIFALETGQEPASELLQFIRDTGMRNLKVNFDPANFLIYNSDKPLEVLEVLKDYIVGVHCKDARRPHEKGVLGSEMSLGKGEVGIPAFITKLKEFSYVGPLTIEREIRDDEQWRRDVLSAKQLLESLIYEGK